MTIRHKAAEYQATASHYHEQAAQYHDEAARHHKTEKAQANAAYQALAMNAYVVPYTDDGGLPEHSVAIARFPARSASRATSLTGAEHHTAAADHHDLAAQHHELAARHWNDKNYQPAIQEAYTARRHAQCAIFHGDEAAIAAESRTRADIRKK